MKDKVDLAKGWFSKADSDLAAARLTLAASGPYDTACFHAQQAAEKLMMGFCLFLRLLHHDDNAAAEARLKSQVHWPFPTTDN